MIDHIAYLNVIAWLEDPLMDSIVTNFWNGPFELDPLWHKSTNYRIIDQIISEHKKYESTSLSTGVYNPGRFSRSETLGMRSFRGVAEELLNNKPAERRSIKKRALQEMNLVNGHIFQFKVWRDSIMVKRVLHGMSIVGYSIAIQILAVLL